jgi:Glycosyltransferase
MLDLILLVDSLHPPLTGIGRYTYELTRRLQGCDEITLMRYFSMGRWIQDPLSELTVKLRNSANTRGANDTVSFRSRMARNRMIVRAYSTISPALFGWQLRGNRKSILHSPNFSLPPFSGKSVSTVHDLSHIIYPQFHPAARVDFLNISLGPSLARADHVITVSETVRQEMIERGLMPPDRVSAIHLAADSVYQPHSDDMLQPAMEALGLTAGGYCLFVGTVEPRKNVERLIRAYGHLPAELRRTWPLVVAGGKGWNSDATHALMARGQEEGWLRYLSFVDQQWLPALYAGARLMAYPSLYEGFGLPIVEAMASGTPVLTSSVSCMPEVAGGAARLVNPLDLDEMAYALQDCLANEIWRTEARARGLARAAALSWDRCAEQTVDVYKRVQDSAI